MRRQTLLLPPLSLSFVVAAPTPANDQPWVKTNLAASPRHREYVTLKHGDRSLQAFVVYPEVSRKVPVVILIHEIFGLSDWAKGWQSRSPLQATSSLRPISSQGQA